MEWSLLQIQGVSSAMEFRNPNYWAVVWSRYLLTTKFQQNDTKRWGSVRTYAWLIEKMFYFILYWLPLVVAKIKLCFIYTSGQQKAVWVSGSLHLLLGTSQLLISTPAVVRAPQDVPPWPAPSSLISLPSERKACLAHAVFCCLPSPAGLVRSSGMFGPTLGFLLGSFCASLWVDVGVVDIGEGPWPPPWGGTSSQKVSGCRSLHTKKHLPSSLPQNQGFFWGVFPAQKLRLLKPGVVARLE